MTRFLKSLMTWQVTFLALLLTCSLSGQNLSSIEISNRGRLEISSFNRDSPLSDPLPVVSFYINSVKYTSDRFSGENGKFTLPGIMEITCSPGLYSPGYKSMITFRNLSADTVLLHNVVPFGASPQHVYITGKGDHPLSRSYLFRPGYEPVNVILPDNAWELGFSAIDLPGSVKVCALVRRNRESVKQGQRRRFETNLYPGGSVSYSFWADTYRGEWQEGLRLMFQDRMLYDVEPGSFDNSLFEREDLKWMRHAYVSHLLQAWDNYLYDPEKGKYILGEFLERGKKWYGGDDFTGIWPTWPTLGIDRRNQWDLFRDMPGGLKGIKGLSELCHKYGSRLFICYNQWDESTRTEDQVKGMASLILATGADGVVHDTWGEKNSKYQETLDTIRKGIVMYPEGMPVPRDMKMMMAGRVHNALYYCPVLNLNKFIKPEFAVFRVAEIYKEPVRREFNLAFFNGYGTEMNIFAPGKPDWAEEQYRYLGRTTRILRENSDNFLSPDFTPLIPTSCDRIWVNAWPLGGKTVYTIYAVIPEGFRGDLFEVRNTPESHFVDIWHHNEKTPHETNGKWMIEAETDAFDHWWLGTNNEGTVDCIVQFPQLITLSLMGDELTTSAKQGDSVRIWAGTPDYEKKPLVVPTAEQTIRLTDHFGRFEGKFIIQLFANNRLADERIIEIAPGTPRLISRIEKTQAARDLPEDMAIIPSGKFTFHTTHGDDFIPYPKYNEGKEYSISSFLMDKTPVTNRQFEAFLKAAGYHASDTARFLAHWTNGKIPEGEENFPVVNVSYEDAQAYAGWVGKRLPTEVEWQYAAQTPALNEWPWEQKKPVKRVDKVITETLTVSSLEGIDPSLCNLGDGHLYPVGKYRKGANPYGLLDLTGCVWQLTHDVYSSGSYTYIILKGGSFFKPSSSWWYVQGGPRELHYRQQLLRISQGFERNATVGFRCVKDRID